MQAVRSTLALQVQRSAGNRAVGQILARNGGGTTAPPAPAVPALKTGKEIDEMLKASKFLEPYAGPKLKKGTQAEGHVHIHDAAAFKAEVLKYFKGKDNPETGKEFTDDEAEKFEPKVRGFQDEGEIHVHEKRGDNGTIVHESMHLFSSVAFVSAVDFNVNEGTTELFARKLCAENGIARAGYPDQYRAVRNLVDKVASETLLADAYFNFKLDPLKAKVDAAKGEGTWDKWLALVTASKYADAEKLL